MNNRFPPRRILVPLDDSDVSLAAWRQAQELGRRFDAKLEGLYVQDWLHSAMGLGVAEPYLTAYAGEEALAAIKKKLGPGADVRAASGPVEPTITSWGKHLGYDLIVMGSHGRTGVERLLKGSVAEMVVRHASCPVLVVRQAPARIRSVLAPINFEPYSTPGLAAAARFAAAMGARLTVLHVVSTPLYRDAGAVKGPKHLLAAAVDGLPEDLKRACQPRAKLAFGDPAGEIVTAAREADVVVLVAHRKGFVHDTILGTTAERVLRHNPKAVLALPSLAAPARSRFRKQTGRATA